MSVRDAPVFWEVCSKLESLELNVVTIRGRMMQPDTVFRDVTSLLKGVGNLTSLRLEFCLLYEDSVQALRRHFPTLVNLELDHSNAIPNSTLQDVLCSCPRLEVLRGGNVFAKGVVEGGPWTCQQLRKLRTCILFEESERDLQKEMFKRLSTLTRLETLIMAAPGYDLNGQENLRVLEFRLENGLGQLASLSQLRAVVFEPNMPGYHVDEDGFEEIVNRRYFPQIGVDEIAWMKLNWKKLGRLSGFLNSDFTLSARLELMVKILDLDGDQPH
ncbi:hypothetical protein BGX31_003349 [Mortierella sp. GBA43]|nr:hypothetical protein BGX31_003349 [Mortierella sp. GBA43]